MIVPRQVKDRVVTLPCALDVMAHRWLAEELSSLRVECKLERFAPVANGQDSIDRVVVWALELNARRRTELKLGREAMVIISLLWLALVEPARAGLGLFHHPHRLEERLREANGRHGVGHLPRDQRRVLASEQWTASLALCGSTWRLALTCRSNVC